MRIRKDLVVDVIYALFISVILLISNPKLLLHHQIITEIFKSLIISSLLFLEIKSLSNNFRQSIYLVNNKKYNLITAGKVLIQFTLVKIILFIMIFILYSWFYLGDFQYDILLLNIFQLLGSVLYVLTSYTIITYLSEVKEWNLVVSIILPYAILIASSSIIGINFTYFDLILPSNIFLIHHLDNTLLAICSTSVGWLGFITAYIIVLKKIFYSNKLYKLPKERSN